MRNADGKRGRIRRKRIGLRGQEKALSGGEGNIWRCFSDGREKGENVFPG